jgi:hypothetical protein
LEWQVAGFGDFSGNPGESDMLMRATSGPDAGDLEVYDISNNKVTSAAYIGWVPSTWTVAGFADFSGNANETDMLLRNSNTGAFEVYDISNNANTSAASMGQVGLELTVAGIAADPRVRRICRPRLPWLRPLFNRNRHGGSVPWRPVLKQVPPPRSQTFAAAFDP